MSTVRVATTVNGTLSTAFANGQTVDGVSLVTGDTILIKNQTTATENGVYIVQASGAPVRSNYFRVGRNISQEIIYVSQGTTNAFTQWTCTNASGADIVGTNNLTFTSTVIQNPVSTDTAQTLTNKTITASTNTVTANNLRSATTSVNVSSATAPTTGQVLTATSSTAATWQTLSATVTSSSATATADTSTTSTTYVIINSMTLTPGAGTYLAIFSSSGTLTGTNNTATYAIFSNGTIIQHSERNITTGGGPTNGLDYTLATQAITTVAAGQTITARYLAPAGQTFTLHERSLILLKIG